MRSLLTTIPFFVAILSASFITCASSSGPSAEDLRLSMETAKKNAAFLAEQWNAHSLGNSDLVAFSRNDPIQSARCPQGSGWADVEMIDRSRNVAVLLKCSTVKALVGCEINRDHLTQKQSHSARKCAMLTDAPWPTPVLTVQ